MTNMAMMINLYFDENLCIINSNLAACDENNIELEVSIQTSSCTNSIQGIKVLGKVHKSPYKTGGNKLVVTDLLQPHPPKLLIFYRKVSLVQSMLVCKLMEQQNLLIG